MSTCLGSLFGTKISSIFTFFICLICCAKTFAQIEPMLTKPSTRAVIVGISAYANISPLRFAHKDAEAFAKYLLSPAGGSLPEENIKLLTNENATAGLIGLSFNWLVANSQEGDRAIIYFSGHGDVETESTDMGYLLAYDAQKTTYMGSGAIAVFQLERVVKKLSEQKHVEVILIADACHSGNLAGSENNGAKVTAIALSNQFAKEVKIMSCEPGQFSQESEVWGGGHSVFSYYLLDGLRGLADKNEDRQVTLREIEGFLFDSVQRATIALRPDLPQSPTTVGNKNAVIAEVNADEIAALRKKNSPSKSEPTASVASKNVAVFDTISARLLLQFEVAMRARHLLTPEAGAAYSIYLEAKDRAAMQPQIEMMRYALAAAMQDDAQKAINDYLVADPREMRMRWGLDDSRYQQYPIYLEKAAELLGKDNFMYSQIKAREYYFRGLNLRLQGERKGGDTMLFNAAIPFQEKTLALDPTAAYAYNELGLLARRFKQYERSVEYFNKAVGFSPTWVLPWTNLCASYNDLGQPELGEKCGKKAIALDSTFALANFNLGYTYLITKENDKAAVQFQRTIDYNPEYADAFYNLGYYHYQNRAYLKAEQLWERYKTLRPNDPDAFQSLAEVYLKQGKTELAKSHLLQAIELNNQYSMAYFTMGELYLNTKDTEQATKWYKDYSRLKPEDPEGYYQLAIACQKDSEQSLGYLKTAFQKGYKDYERLKNEAGFDSLHSMPQYSKLIKEYFPGQK